MKCISKTNILRNNSGETMVEVLVAFTLLSIMLVMFAEGITWASKSEINALKSRQAADQAMMDVQSRLAGGERDAGYSQIGPSVNYRIMREKIVSQGSDGRSYTYVYYEAMPIP